VLAAVLVGSAASLTGSTASAIPPNCPDGSPPPCVVPDPPPPPPHASWRVNVASLVQDPAGLAGTVAADRTYLSYPVLEPAVRAKVVGPTLPGPWTQPAGTATLSGGTLTFPSIALPSGSTMVLRLREAGAPGSLCRTRPTAPLPPNGQPLHLLVPAPSITNAADLSSMVSGFRGPQTGLPTGVTLDITATTLTPRTNGLELWIQGTLGVNEMRLTLGYRLLLNLDPVNGTDVSKVLSVRAPGPGTVDLTWIGTPPANGDNIRLFIAAVLEGQLRSRVVSAATPLVNDQVLGRHDVRWWTEQGFTLSVRRVAYSATGLTISPSLCLLG